MATMLPAPEWSSGSLAQVSSRLCQRMLESEESSGTRLTKVALVVIDGMGADLIRSHSGHARFLNRQLGQQQRVAWSGVPSTTATALASLTTGVEPIEHGLLGYQVRDPETRQVVNHLKPYPEAVRPETWQPIPTVFERLGHQGIESITVGESRFAGTDFSRSILRGAEHLGSYRLEEHLHHLRNFFDRTNQGLAYLYWPALDRAGHQSGVDSVAWRDALEEVDAFVATLQGELGEDERAFVIADHGMVDVAPAFQWVMPSSHPLRSAIDAWAGEPRCLHLYLYEPEHRVLIGQELQRELGDRAAVRTRDEFLTEFFPGAPHQQRHLSRIGDLVVLSRENWALYDERTSSVAARSMVGQHGSVTPVETRVPVIHLGRDLGN